ncbi:mucin, putative [Brugia malayi]|uniref:Mucin, putative n=1 Tax=Brugia malayi TaxID=6279 RepID=A0A4E9FCB8_BRUMA|nr:mucin, putative [Brugia malayi]VIO92388.1 mucin, putative [Brugia malayi]
MPAYYTTSVTQTTPAATTSGSIGGNAAMSGYNYYSMTAYYTTSVTQTTPTAAATTSDSIGGNAAMNGYNYYLMPVYCVASVAQTTLYNQAGTIYGASGNIGQPSGYGIPMSGYYQMPQNPSTVNRQYGSGMFYGQQPVVYPSVAQATAYSSFPRTHEQVRIFSCSL